jgi:hypothetical protein
LGTRNCNVRFTPTNRHRQLDPLRPKNTNKRHQGNITLLAIAASAGELSFTARCAHLETVKPSLAYWTLKVLIGTAVPNAFWMAHPTVLE